MNLRERITQELQRAPDGLTISRLAADIYPPGSVQLKVLDGAGMRAWDEIADVVATMEQVGLVHRVHDPKRVRGPRWRLSTRPKQGSA